MSHTSPATYLAWSILSCLLGAFLVFHLWSFDRFKCLRWNSGPYSGAFKRVMTYSYILCIPLVTLYSLGFCIIKYRQGYSFTPENGVVPTPYDVWPESDQRMIFPLYLIFAVAWSLEMVTHLEELCFWLFLMNARTTQQDWFRSYYFRTWVVGSVIAVVYMPLVTIFTRADNLKCEAATFLAGSMGSLCLTLWFMPILWSFPSFVRDLRAEGADMGTVARLTKFHELNTLRVIFRFLFVAPLLILGADGIRSHQHLNENMAITDVLAMLAAVGCTISSAMTLVIFFPRQIETEIQVKQAKKIARTQGRTHTHTHTHSHSDSHSGHGTTPKPSAFLLTSSPVKESLELDHEVYELPYKPSYNPWDSEPTRVNVSISPKHDNGTGDLLPPLSPNRRKSERAPWDGDVEQGGTLSERNLRRHNQRMTKYNKLVHNYTSPIDLMS